MELLEYIPGLEKKVTVELQNDLMVSLALDINGRILRENVRVVHLFKDLKSLLNHILPRRRWVD